MAVAVIFSILTGVSGALLLGHVTTVMNQPGAAGAPAAWFFIALWLIVVTAGVVPPMVMVRLSQEAAVQIRLQLTERILAAPLATLERLTSPPLVTALADDIQAVAAAAPTMIGALVHVTVIAGCLVLLAWTSIAVLASTATLLAAAVLIQRAMTARGTERLMQAREVRDALMRDVHSLIGGIKELKLHHRRQREFLSSDVQPALENHRRHLVASSDTFTATNAGIIFLIYGYVGFLLFGGTLLLGLSPNAVRRSLFTLFFLIAPVAGLLASIPALARAHIGWKRLRALDLDLRAPAPAGLAERALPASAPVSIELRDVMHTYRREDEEGSFTLGPIDLTLRSGEIVFIVGGNGSGKTTLAKVLTGLYPPHAGTIVCGGAPVDDETRAAYSQLFSTVFSDAYVFDRLFGVSQVDSRADVVHYLQRFGLQHRVDFGAERLAVTRLSEGQRKRLALLIAYLDDRPVFVFDEWASNQDPEFRRTFYEELLPELRAKGKAVLAITHDDQYFWVADRLAKLDKGKPVPADATRDVPPPIAVLVTSP